MKKNRVIAVVVMALMILLAVPMGFSRSMGRQREKAAESYYYDDAGYAIFEGMETRQEIAEKLVDLARDRAGEDAELSVLADDLERLVQRSDANNFLENLAQGIEIDRELGETAEALAARLEETELSRQEENAPARYVAQLQAERRKMENSSYNDDARAFNARLRRFPANLLRHVTGVGELPVFEQG